MLCIAADEYSKCLLIDEDKRKIRISALSNSMYSIGGFLVFSGFSYRDAGRICTRSERPVVEKILLPMTKFECDEYKDLIDSIKESYSIPSFPHYLYECVKFSPGL